MNADDFPHGVPIVIDNGTGAMKAGFAGDDAPEACFPCVVGRLDRTKYSTLIGVMPRDCYVGEEAQSKRGLLSISYPMKHGIVTTQQDWDDMTEIWNYTITSELETSPNEHPILMTEAPENPVENRMRMYDTMFEYFNVPAMYVETQAVLSLYASSSLTGTVLDSGDGVTHVVPVVDGFVIPRGIRRLDLAGRDLTEYLITQLLQHGSIVRPSYDETKDAGRKTTRPLVPNLSFLRSSAGIDIARQLKESLCEVHSDFDKLQDDLTHVSTDEYERITRQETKDATNEGLPTIRLGPERYKVAEALFKPSLLGMDAHGIHEMVVDSVESCPFDIQYQLYSNILLSGGTTLMKGLEGRLESEIRKLTPSAMEPRVDAPFSRRYSCWIGGAVLASLSTFQDMWKTKAMYDEQGPYRLCRR